MTQLLILMFLLLPSWAYGQTVNSRTEAGNGTPITATGSRLDVQIQSGTALDATLTGRFPAAFASADNIAAQTATFMHGGLMAWDSAGGNWDRVLLTAGALNVQIQNSSLAVTGTFWQATQPVSGTVAVSNAFALDTSVDGLEGGIGASADAAATVGSAGSISAKLRLITSQLDALQTELNQKTEPANTQTISGTVTANAGTNLNTSALALDTSVDGLEAVLGTTGDAAATAGSTGSLSAKERLMTTQLGAIQTSVQLIDDAISGAGFNLTQIGGTNVVTGTGASGSGIPRFTVSNDSNILSTQSGTWTMQPGNTANTTPWLQTINQGGNSATVSSAGGLKVEDGSPDGTAFTAGTSPTTEVGGVYNESLGAMTSGTSGAFRLTAKRAEHVNLRDSSGVELGTKAMPLAVAMLDTYAYGSGFVDSHTQRVELALNSQGQVRLAAGSQTIGAILGTQADNSLNSTKKLPVLDAIATNLPPFWSEGNQVPLSTDWYGSARARLMDAYGAPVGTPGNPLSVQIQGLGLLSPATNPLAIPAGFGGLNKAQTSIAFLANQGAYRGFSGAVQGDYGLVVHPSIAPALQCPFVKNISVTATTQLVTNAGGQLIHVCSFSVVLAGAESVSLVEGTGTTCGTGTTGLYGGTSASAAFATNGGVALTSDRITIPMQVKGDHLCLLKSAANNASGMLSYGIY